MDRTDHDRDAADVPRPGPSGRGTAAGDDARPPATRDPDAPGRRLAEESDERDGGADPPAGEPWPEPNEPA